MAWASRWLSVGVIGLSGWAMTGCASSLPSWALPDKSMAVDLSAPLLDEGTYRGQAGGGPPATLQKPTFLPDSGPPPIAPPPPLPGTSGTIQRTSLTPTNRGTLRVSVRAWVNGRPIFDDEIMQLVGPELNRLSRLPEPQRSQQMAEVTNKVLDNIIDAELMYQDAVKRLEKQPSALNKLKEFVDQEYDKSLQRMRKAKVPEEAIRDMEPVAKRMIERNLVSGEYARSRIRPILEARVSFDLIRDYYEAHKNEFQTVDKVVWQDIFIPVSANLPTVDAVKRFADNLLAQCRSPQDFNRLMVYNAGDSKFRNGEGLGQLRGSIQPPEFEKVLFQMTERDIGLVMPHLQGVHIIRVQKREYAGQLPFNDQTQKTIRRKLEGQLFEKEYQRLVRELRTRYVYRIERETP